MALVLDYSLMLAPGVANGVTEPELDGVEGIFRGALDRMRARREAGELGFLDLPSDGAMLDACTRLADSLDGTVDDVVVLGIGGSALGMIALRAALLPPFWNMLSAEGRGARPRIHVLDNVDPGTIDSLLAMVDPGKTIFAVISKSGSTAETMAQYMVVRGRLDSALGGDAVSRIVLITDPEKGVLRALARNEGIASLEVPANVGGRFSVLSAVGIFPAMLAGIDVRSLLAGAEAMRRRCEERMLRRNPAGMYATLQWLADTRRGANIHVMMPYADPLREFSLWFVQLWAESLGKISAAGEHVGPTPVASVGASDQHSQVQLFMEGPLNKTVTFISPGKRTRDVVIPAQGESLRELSYLAGHTLGELLDVECRATAGALAARGRPSMTIAMPTVNAHHVGELIMLLEIATVLAGDLYGVNAMNQPGVELGKQYTYGILGKPDSGAALAEWERLQLDRPSGRNTV